ncbi:neuropeptide Y receptor type 4-like [Actinia tenebrosa]|uniref:Neuropeptide Y receptor type 4-like n=1 Tax=Actinia tenebrosa TaxID=6105 RepID=A0A6P8IXX9_ACTTE|nr:neuropeptide Y receptor type 4-like [Actinia tenebrosa]
MKVTFTIRTSFASNLVALYPCKLRSNFSHSYYSVKKICVFSFLAHKSCPHCTLTMNNTSLVGTSFVPLDEGKLSSQINLAIHVMTLVIGSVANILVLAVVVTKSKKTDQDVMIINLCLTDWLIIMVKFPLKLDTNLEYINWTDSVCKFVEIIPTLCHYVGIYAIVVMAVHRCRVLLNPFKAKMKLKTAVVCCIVIWVLSYLFLLPLIFYRVGYFGKSCVVIPLTDCQNRLFQIYRIIGYVIAFPIPLLIIAFSYFRLGMHLYRQRIPRVAYVQGNLNMNAGRRQNLEIIKTLAVIVIAFALFMLPLFIVRIQYEVKSNAERVAKHYINFIVYSRLIALSHSCVNPVIYGSLTKHFRQKYRQWFCQCFQRNFNVSRMNTWNVQNFTATNCHRPDIIIMAGKFGEHLGEGSATGFSKLDVPFSTEAHINHSSL